MLFVWVCVCVHLRCKPLFCFTSFGWADETHRLPMGSGKVSGIKNSFLSFTKKVYAWKKKQNDESTVLTKRSSFGWTISISMPIFECFVSAPVPRVNVRFFRGAIPSTAAGRSSRGQHAQIQLICVRQCRQISVGGVFVTAFIGWTHTHTHTLLPSHSRRLIGLIRVIN